MAFKEDFDYTAPYRETQANKQANNPTPIETLMSLRDNAHTALDVGGMVPGVGMASDAINSALYAAEGDKGNAALSAAAMVPIAGLGAGGAKIFKQIYAKMKKVGVGGLNRTESSYIKRNFDKFKDELDLTRDYEDGWNDIKNPDEYNFLKEGRKYNRYVEDEGLQGLHKTMKKSTEEIARQKRLSINSDLIHGEKSLYDVGASGEAVRRIVMEDPQKLMNMLDLNLSETNKMFKAIAPDHPNRLGLEDKIADLNNTKAELEMLIEKAAEKAQKVQTRSQRLNTNPGKRGGHGGGNSGPGGRGPGGIY